VAGDTERARACLDPASRLPGRTEGNGQLDEAGMPALFARYYEGKEACRWDFPGQGDFIQPMGECLQASSYIITGSEEGSTIEDLQLKAKAVEGLLNELVDGANGILARVNKENSAFGFGQFAALRDYEEHIRQCESKGPAGDGPAGTRI